ncbi:hypothetical protein AAC387_Pa04g0451 [Persea americana]
MEKNKNRSDLLAAGRKKLQQFQKKKEKKGGSSSSSSNVKSMRKTSESEQESVDADAASIRPLANVKPDGGGSPLVPADLLVSPSLGEGEAEVSHGVESLAADMTHVDSSALVLPQEEGRSPLLGDAELVPADLLVSHSPDEGGAEVSGGIGSLVADGAPVDSLTSVLFPDEGRSQHAIDAELASVDLSVSPSPNEGGAEVPLLVDSLVADVVPVASLAQSVSGMAVGADAELGPVDSLVPPSVVKLGDGQCELTCAVDSSLDAKVVTRMGDAEVVPVGSLVTSVMVNGDDNLIPVDLSAPLAYEEAGEGGVAVAELDRENQGILPEMPHIQSIDGDTKLVHTGSSAPSASEEAGQGGAALAEIDGENQEHFPNMPQIQPIDGDLKSETASGKEAEHSHLDHSGGNVEESWRPLQDHESSEVGRLENERHGGLVFSEIPDMDRLTEDGYRNGPVLAEEICGADRSDDVIVHGVMSGDGLEIPFLSQTFATEQADGAQGKIEQEGSVEEMHKYRYFPESVIVESKMMEEPLEVERAGLLEGLVISPGENAGSLDAYAPAKVLEGPDEEKARFLLKSTERGMVCRVLPEVDFADSLEAINRQLYLTNIAKDIFYIQLVDQIEEQTAVNQRDQLLLDEVFKLRNLVKETQESNASISEEFAQCRSQVWAMTTRNEELEKRCLSARKEIDELSAKSYEFQNKWKQSQEEVTPLLAELASCKSLLEASQMENANLTGNLLSATEEQKTLEVEKEYFTKENMKLSADLLQHKENLVMAHDKQVQLEAYVKEEMMFVEQLTEENIYLSSSLELHKDIMKEAVDKYRQLYSDAAGAGCQPEKVIEDSQFRDENFDGGVAVSGQVESVPVLHLQGYLVSDIETKDFDDSDGLFALKVHLEEVEKMVQKLEKDIHELQTHSVSSNRAGSKVTSPGISKLIQAFESKVHQEETASDEVPQTEERSADPFLSAREQTANLRAMLKQLDLDAEKANELLKREQDSTRLATVSLSEVQAEYESQKAQNNILVAKNDSMVEKLAKYEKTVDGLLNQFNELQQNADERACLISHQVVNLQKEVDDNTSILEHQRNSLLSAISEAVEKLDTQIELLAPTALTCSNNSDVGSRITVSVDAATKTIQGLHDKLEAAYLDHERISNSYEELNQKFMDIHGKNEVAIGLLDKIYSSLRKLVNESHGNMLHSVVDVKSEALLDLVSSDGEVLMAQLQELLNERQHFQSLKNRLESELMKTTQDLEEWSKRCLDLSAKVEENKNNANSEVIAKLVEDVEGVIQPEVVAVDSEKPPVIHLEALVGCLLQKYKEASEQVSLSKHCLQEYVSRPITSAEDSTVLLHILLREEFGSKVLELKELQEKINQLQSLNLEQEDEIRFLKESLSKIEEALEVVRSELQAKGTELEQSEQRLSSVREKLGIAVSKGKGLIVQRDSLKQSLAEKSSELDRYLQDLQSKNSIIHDLEVKLKMFSESGERVEALESELSYIRNSATALRESFLLKDSVLQRIEEILENLELPEHFHSRDTIEKIEWLARSIPRSSLPLTEWDQKSSIGGSYSDGGFVVMDAWKEDLQPSSNSELDDLRRKFDELQNKFYGLAEHNEMLEQSLVDRNDLVQRWEEVLDRIDMPLQLRSMEPVDRIDWLRRALSEAEHERDSLLLKIENLELSSDSLLVELEESQKKLSDLTATLGEVEREKKLLSESLEKIRSENEEISEQAAQGEVEKAELQKEIANLDKKLIDLQEELVKHDHIENDIMRLIGSVNDALPDHDPTDLPNSSNMVDYLEGALMKMIDMHTSHSLEKSMPKDMEKELASEETDAKSEEQRLNHALDAKERELLALKEELDGALGKLVLVKGERDAAVEKCQALVVAVEGISKERDHLQEQLDQEEQKAAVLREKLNVAVRKGKGLVQQRDSLKQAIDEMNAEKERLKGELNQRGDALVQYEQKVGDLLALSGKVEALESENVLLRSHLAETEQNLQDSGRTMSRLMTALHAINADGHVDIIDPVQRMEEIGKLTHDLHAAAVSSKQEAKKSKRAAELLVAELNEVHERADSIQEELAKAEDAVAGLSKQRDIAEAARIEALSNLEQFTAVHSEEKRKQNADLMRLKAGIDQLRKECFEFANIISNFFSKDLELLNHVSTVMVSCLKELNGSIGNDHFFHHSSGGIFSSVPVNEDKLSPINNSSELKMQDDDVQSDLFAVVGRGLQECVKEIDGIKNKYKKHSISCDHHAAQLPKIMENIQSKILFQKESSESQTRDITHLELLIKEKDTEISVVHKNISLLYEACTNSIWEIESRKAHMIRNDLASGVVHLLGNTGSTSDVSTFGNTRDSWNRQTYSFTEEDIRTLADTLLSAVKESTHMQAEFEVSNERELKATISHLQKELQEKDIHQNRICAELVAQIKEAEATARNYSVDLDSTKTQLDNLVKQVEVMKNERKLLEMQISEKQDSESLLKEFQERVKSLTDGLSAKDQEIESLMQALDEEESQMEGLATRIEELEKIVQEKNLALENLEASRGKAMAKLSTTVSRFNELHHLSESLLSEVKNLESQLQGRDAEISFLRQEVTRCTNDVLALQESNKRKSAEVEELLTWSKNMLALHFGVPDVDLDDQKGSQVHAYSEILEKHIASVLSELNDLRVTVQSRDVLLQSERQKVEDLVHKGELLEISLRDKETQLKMLQEPQHSGQPDNMNPTEILEVEPIRNKRAVTLGPITPHVRSVRKVNNDQVAIGIDMESGVSALDDEDDDKGHGFKSLTMSRIVPRASRPIADRIDGLWVSGGRVLMRQPTMRLGIVFYWIMLHVLLASSFI